MGVTKHISQGEGGEQGDPLMPMLFALEQHGSLVAAQGRLRDNEHVLAYHDDVYTVCKPARVADVHGVVDEELLSHAHIQLHHGKTQVWNRGRTGASRDWSYDQGCESGKTRRCGDPLLPVHKQGLKVLGIPISEPAFVDDFLESKSRERQTLFQRIPWVNDPQAAYLLLPMCASTRANFWLRSVRPEQTQEYAARHDDNVWSCLLQILGMQIAPPCPRVLSGSGLPHSGPAGPIPSA